MYYHLFPSKGHKCLWKTPSYSAFTLKTLAQYSSNSSWCFSSEKETPPVTILAAEFLSSTVSNTILLSYSLLVIKDTFKVLYSIRIQPLNSRVFIVLCSEVRDLYGLLLMHSEISRVFNTEEFRKIPRKDGKQTISCTFCNK